MSDNNFPSMESFLQQQFIEWVRRKGRMASQAEWSKYLGVSGPTLSQWMTGNRLPAGDNIHKLASKLGPMIYDILGEPRRMPGDPLFNQLATDFFAAPNEARQRAVELLAEEARKAREIEDEGDKVSPA